MDKVLIEKEARRVQYEVWSRRALLWPMGEPRPEALFEPRIVAGVLGLEFEFRERLEADGSRGRGAVAAGQLDRRRGILAVSTEFKYPTQRFTAAHEIGHFVIHPWIGDKVVHRDRPVYELGGSVRPVLEQEADYFAACLLVPRQALVKEFEARFGTRKPLPLTETIAFHLKEANPNRLFSAPKGSLLFASELARAQSFDTKRFRSLAECFGVSTSAMAIRLHEVGLVED